MRDARASRGPSLPPACVLTVAVGDRARSENRWMSTVPGTGQAGYWGHLRVRRAESALQLFLRAFLPFVVVLLTAGAAALNWRIDALERDLDVTIGAFLELAGERFEKDLTIPIQDLQYLSRELQSGTLLTSTLASRLHHLALARERYTSIRIIDVRGSELLHIDATSQQTVGQSPAHLGDWSRSNLFTTLGSMRDGELYVSSFELHASRGKIVEPIEPILRFAVPLSSTTGQRTGFLVIDLDARPSLAALRVANPNGYVELLTNDGYWVKAHDPELEWGAVLSEREHVLFSTMNARAWGEMIKQSQGSVRMENGAFWFRIVQPPAPSVDSPSWKLILHVPQDRLRARNLGVISGLALLALAAAAIAAPFYWWLAHKARPTSAAG
jgi:hypothetical protein